MAHMSQHSNIPQYTRETRVIARGNGPSQDYWLYTIAMTDIPLHIPGSWSLGWWHCVRYSCGWRQTSAESDTHVHACTCTYNMVWYRQCMCTVYMVLALMGGMSMQGDMLINIKYKVLCDSIEKGTPWLNNWYEVIKSPLQNTLKHNDNTGDWTRNKGHCL